MTRREINSWLMDMDGVLVRDDAERFPFRASRTLESVADLADELG